MDATAAIAIAGLTTALLGTLAVPLMQAHFTGKREAASRTDERRHATYVDAITYAQVAEERLHYLTEDPLYRSNRPLPETPDELMIRAKLVLVAPADVAHAFDELTRAWGILGWNLNENGPAEMDGNTPIYVAKSDDKDVVRVAAALTELKSALRPKALGPIEKSGRS
jgi:hypothetical protein